jgi:hypothetical protein
MRWFLISTLFVSLAVYVALSQNTASSSRIHVQGALQVDGSVTPEAIPDATAYRLVFLSLCGNNPSKPALQQRLVARVKLSEQDALVLQSQLLASCNPPNDDLVSRLRPAINDSLSKDGISKLDAFVRREKKAMGIYSSPEMH